MVGDLHVLVQVSFIYFLNGHDDSGPESAQCSSWVEYPHVFVQVSFIYFFNGHDDSGPESAHRGWRSSCPGSGIIHIF